MGERSNLGYIIHRLKEAGIPYKLSDHGSFHADHVLYVDASKTDKAGDILAERWHKGRGKPCSTGRTTLDDMPDDAKCFAVWTALMAAVGVSYEKR